MRAGLATLLDADERTRAWPGAPLDLRVGIADSLGTLLVSMGEVERGQVYLARWEELMRSRPGGTSALPGKVRRSPDGRVFIEVYWHLPDFRCAVADGRGEP